MTSTNFYGIDLDDAGPPRPVSYDDLEPVWRFLKPKSSATPLIRLGDDVDGSYLVPDDLEGIAACFSPGANKIKHFEDVLTDQYGIQAHMCDFSCTAEDFATPLREGMQTFAKKWLDVERGEDNLALEDWVHEHDVPGDLLLQIDIEGAEYRNLLAVPDETLARFRVVVMELHGLGKMLDAAVLAGVLGPFFEKLGRHFTTVHAHPNNCCGEFQVPGTDIRVPHVLELTLVRHDHFRPGAAAVALPHPLDVSRNVPRRPPLFLSEAWCDHARPLESRVKMLEDTLRYRDDAGSTSAEDAPGGVLALTMRSLQTLARTSLPAHPGSAALVEVARGCHYRTSSSYGDGPRVGVVQPAGAYFFHTAFGPEQWIRVDLGRPRRVGRVEVVNRTDGYQDRARFLFVELSLREDGTGETAVFPMHKVGKLPVGAWRQCAIDLPEVTARFVTVRSPVNTALHFADLSVLAAEDDDVPAGRRSLPARGANTLRRAAARVRRSRRAAPRHG